MLEHLPSGVSSDGELVPGGDIRAAGNLWLRQAYKDAKLGKVPRETQVRLAILKLIKKKKIGSLAYFMNVFLIWVEE